MQQNRLKRHKQTKHTLKLGNSIYIYELSQSWAHVRVTTEQDINTTHSVYSVWHEDLPVIVDMRLTGAASVGVIIAIILILQNANGVYTTSSENCCQNSNENITEENESYYCGDGTDRQEINLKCSESERVIFIAYEEEGMNLVLQDRQ